MTTPTPLTPDQQATILSKFVGFSKITWMCIIAAVSQYNQIQELYDVGGLINLMNISGYLLIAGFVSSVAAIVIRMYGENPKLYFLKPVVEAIEESGLVAESQDVEQGTEK